jgi:putative ABC transport system permease protein
MLFAIPVAWLQLTHQKVRLAATLAGLSFVAILLFIQLAFQDALFGSAVRVHENVNAELVMLSDQYEALTAQQSFPLSRLYQTLAFDRVESITPVYFQFGRLKNIENGGKSSIFIFGIDPGKITFDMPEVNDKLDMLKVARTALFDRESRPEFGPIPKTFEEEGNVMLEITPFNTINEANRLEVKGLFTLGPSFGVDGNLITNVATFMSMFADRSPDSIDIGLIKLKPGASVKRAKAELVKFLPPDVRVMTRQEFIDYEKQYWNDRTPIGFSFRLMVIMGFVVGIGIAYQILYSNIANHITEYATLKAIGFTNNYLLTTVFQQAALLAVMSFGPGFFASLRIYELARDSTRLPIVMTTMQGTVVFVALLLMCTVSGLFAMQKLRSADPADIF